MQKLIHQVNELIDDISRNYPGSQFDIYECPTNGGMISKPVSYVLYHQGLNSPDGVKIGVCNAGHLSWRELQNNNIESKTGYRNNSVVNVYTESTEWWMKNPPGQSLY